MPRIRIPIDDILSGLARKPVSSAVTRNVDVNTFSRLNKITNLDMSPKAVENLNTSLSLLDEGDEIFEHLDKIKAGLNLEDAPNFLDVNEARAFQQHGAVGLVKNISSKLDDAQKADALSKRATQYYKKLSNKAKASRGFRSFFDDQLRSIEQAVNNNQTIIENNLMNTMRTKFGTEGVDFVKNAGMKPQELEKIYGISDKQLVAGFLDENIKHDNKVAQTFTDTMRDQFRQSNEALKSLGVPISGKDKYLNPFKIPLDVTRYIGKEKFSQLLVQHTNLKLESILKIVENYSRNVGNPNAFTIQPLTRNMNFKSGDDAISFYSAVKGWNQDTNMMAEYMNSIRAGIRANTTYAHYGGNPLNTINRAMVNVKSLKPDAKEINQAVKNFGFKLRQYGNQLFQHETQIEQMGTIFSQFVGLATGAPARAVFRNGIIDFEAHAAAVGNGIYNPNYSLGNMVSGVWKNFSYLGKHARRGHKFRESTDQILNIMDFANSMDSMSFSHLALTQDITDSASFFASKSEKILNNTLVGFNKVTDQLYKMSGNNSLIDAKRSRQLISFQQLWSKNFDNFRTYDDWFANGVKEKPQLMQNFEAARGIDRNVWEFLKKANRVDLGEKIAKESKKKFGFANIPDFITRDSIMLSDNEIARKFKRATETTEQFKQRVSRIWQSLVYDTMIDSVPVPTYTDAITKRMVPESGLLHVGLRGILKFADVANAQFINLRTRIARQVYGDTTQYIGFDKSPLLYLNAFKYYLAGAVGVQWAKDIGNNRKPTDFRNLDSLAPLMVSTGYGGYINTVISNMFQVYGDAGSGIFTGTPAGSVQTRMGRMYQSAMDPKNPNKAYEVAKGIANISGYGQLWGVKGMLDYTLRASLLTPAQDRRYERSLRSWGKSSVFVPHER